MIYIIPYLFLLIGYGFIFFDKILEPNYLGILIFFTIKIIFNYRKCTISYLECKLRGVKKEKGYLYRFLDGIVDLRYTDHFYVLFTLASVIYYYHFIIKKQSIKIL